MWRTDLCQFRWPSVTADPDFKVTTFLKSNIWKTKGQIYSSTLIGNHTEHIEWKHVWWPWLTSKRVARFVSISWACCHCWIYQEDIVLLSLSWGTACQYTNRWQSMSSDSKSVCGCWHTSFSLPSLPKKQAFCSFSRHYKSSCYMRTWMYEWTNERKKEIV